MRTQRNQWQAIDNRHDKAFGRLQSTDPLLVSRVWNDLLTGRPISIQGPSGQSISLDREKPRILCDATVAQHFGDGSTLDANEGSKPLASIQRQKQE